VSTAPERLGELLGIPPLWARLLVSRGIDSVEAYTAWIDPAAPLTAPDRLPDMAAAADLLRYAIRQHRRIRVQGDYDCDGVTATALLVRTLTALGGVVDWRVPNRFDEGYGLSPEAVFQASQAGVDLIVTVDCGSSSPDAARLADTLGMGLIITDHHRLGPEAPRVPAHVNPERAREGGAGQWQVLSGAGVALQLARMLLGDEAPPVLWALAALGTVADVVPLKAESRVVVRRGLQAIQQGAWVGAGVLARSRDVAHITAETLAFFVAPRINAAGRMGSPDPAVEVCLTDRAEVAEALAAVLDARNAERRQVEAEVLREAWSRIPRDRAGRLPAFLVVAGDHWHEGVLGIVAARLAERLKRPAAVIGWNGSSGKGSARSGGSGDVLAVLRAHGERFTRLGGHRGAAGFSLPREAFAGLGEALADTWSARFGSAKPARPQPDARVAVEELTPALARFLDGLGPYGHEFPPFQLACDAEVEAIQPMGEGGRHARLRLKQAAVDHVVFHGGPWPRLEGRRLSGSVVLEGRWWQNAYRPQARWVRWDWPERTRDAVPAHPQHDDAPSASGGLVLVDDARRLRQLNLSGPVEKVWPHATPAELAELAVRHDPSIWYAATWWHPLDWDGPPFAALWILDPPPHRWALEAALSHLAPGAPVYWSPRARDGAGVLRKWRRLVPDRDRLLRLWDYRRRGLAPLMPGRRILSDLGLWDPAPGPVARRALTGSLHYRTALYERAEAERQWAAGGRGLWDAGLASAGAGDP
jgi:single-stranded-DNA-specific exonuclease